MLTSPKVILRLEGGAMLFLSVFFYRELQFSWARFALLFLLPDLSMLGYLGGVRLGATLYNLVHTYTGPVILLACAFLTQQHPLFALALIWSGHIGIDRLLGFGLKYPTAFGDTHFQRV